MFPNEHYLTIYQKTHKVEKSFNCDQCDNFPLITVFLNYQRTHNGEKPFECNLCDDILTN